MVCTFLIDVSELLTKLILITDMLRVPVTVPLNTRVIMKLAISYANWP